MTRAAPRRLLSASAFILAFAVAACGERPDDSSPTSGADRTSSRTTQTSQVTPRDASTSRAPATGTMGAAADAKVDDNKLTSMVLTGLKADKELNPLRIDVDTREGVVTLSGSVPSAAAKARASEIALNVKDVKSVNNQLTLSTS